MADQQPIIVKKVKKGGHAHHGGAWKLAYADFVTAMMAFFLLMWLLGTTSEPERKGIAEYFQDPFKASTEERGLDVGDRTSIIQAGGSDITSQDQGQVDKGKTAEEVEITPEEIEHKAEELEKEKLENLKQKIQYKIDSTPELNEFKEQIKLEITSEGLRILIVDAQNRPMYKLASAETEPQIKLILRALAPVINELPNKVSLNGHTDARPFPPNQKKYTNWELSSDRANAARYELNQAGLAEEKILRVIGLSSSVPYSATAEPLDPINRRISIIVMNKKTEQEILQNVGEEPVTEAAPPPKE
ncbi:flagellar motor protein MotB [Methylobacter tundripaludum]|uniref:OmpA/MotB domain protein n=1 Tax=Methylobacter tundripaludum (strain ATCC BAA-1195 / DSM 17260 / SV96) TaxID=697282 RepID=G3J292_METTV|nr:flagellar motor protein MotB [Methylobacter tundripaludum]EGW19848.1 OmpA/MotB domain protein [Methylobacter tundripaludum SV96]